MTDVELLTTEDPAKFTLKFGGKVNDINAATYGALLINTVTLLEEANKELQTGVQLEIRVKQDREGSYLVDLAVQSLIVAGVLSPLITPQNIEIIKATAKRVIGTVADGFKVWKALKGEKPAEIKAEGENVIIVTGDNNKILVDRSVEKLVLENKRSQDALSSSFEALSKDPLVETFEILDETETPLFESDQTEFPLLSKKAPRLLPDKTVETESIHLHIIRQSFDPNLNSEYLYKGIRVSASIADKTFWQRVDRGERFGKGDILFVDLEIQKEFSKSLNTYENKGYTIIKVHQHIPRVEQPTLDFPD